MTLPSRIRSLAWLVLRSVVIHAASSYFAFLAVWVVSYLIDWEHAFLDPLRLLLAPILVPPSLAIWLFFALANLLRTDFGTEFTKQDMVITVTCWATYLFSLVATWAVLWHFRWLHLKESAQ